jgi:RNA polymerase-binding protein DksA
MAKVKKTASTNKLLTPIGVKKKSSVKKKLMKPTRPRQVGIEPRPQQKILKMEPSKGAMKKNFSRQELEHFKEIILEKKKEILEELSTLRDSMMDSTTGEYVSENSMYSTHMEQGTDAMEREKTFLFASREGKFLNYLEDALVRIEKGEYGRCTQCGKLIEKERLEAVPHAQQCLQCKLRMGK